MTTRVVPRAAVLAAAALLCASLFTAWLVPLFDPDEGYYPATAAESADAGRPWDLQFNGQPRWDKPVLSYALIQSAFALLGRSEGAARVPSAVEGAALVLAVGALVGGIAGPQAGGLSALVLSTTTGVQIFSRVAHPEIALALSIGLTQLLLAWWLIRPNNARWRWLPVLIGVSMAYGELSKGPVAIAIPAIGVALAAPFVIDLGTEWAGAVRDAVIAGGCAVGLAAPWYVAMTLRHGPAFLRTTLWTQNVARYTGQLAVHASASPVYYVLPAIVALLPWTALLPTAVARTSRPRAGDSRSALRWSMAMMALATFGFYSLSASKLASYILGLAPSVSVLIGLYLDEELAREEDGATRAYRATSLVLLLVAAVLIAVPFTSGRIWSARQLIGGAADAGAGARLFSVALPPAAALAIGSVLVLVLRGRAQVVSLAAVGVAVPLVVLLTARPVVDAAYPWRQFASRIVRDPAPIWVANYRTPSLTFYTRRPVVRITDDKDLDGIIDGGEGWLIVPETRATTGPLLQRIEMHRAAIVDWAGSLVLVRLTF